MLANMFGKLNKVSSTAWASSQRIDMEEIGKQLDVLHKWYMVQLY